MKTEDDIQMEYLAAWKEQQVEKCYYKAMIQFHWNALVDWIRKYFRREWKNG